VLVDGEARNLGLTPLAETALAMGSYVVVLKKDGYRDTRYPVSITRNRAWQGEVRLCTEEEVGRGFVYVPAGPCVLGGDEEAYNSWPQKAALVEDFFIAEHPVTMGEYVEYVNEVARREGLEAARLRSPRRTAEVAASNYLLEDGAGGLSSRRWMGKAIAGTRVGRRTGSLGTTPWVTASGARRGTAVLTGFRARRSGKRRHGEWMGDGSRGGGGSTRACATC